VAAVVLPPNEQLAKPRIMIRLSGFSAIDSWILIFAQFENLDRTRLGIDQL
jgi:hypothetical protein